MRRSVIVTMLAAIALTAGPVPSAGEPPAVRYRADVRDPPPTGPPGLAVDEIPDPPPERDKG
ncbi:MULTISPECIES: hypothetical protein [Micromonospora]|uniref:hypothetical protein n=1 Tax=Micromonospora TaxID=1873 RepID=UPI0011C40708|nr:hypothetical protein [Micromonospora sp. BL1]